MGILENKALTASMYVAVPIAVYSLASAFYAHIPTTRDVRPYLEANAERLHREVEERYGIKMSPVDIEFKLNFEDASFSVSKSAPMRYRSGAIHVNLSSAFYIGLEKKDTQASFPYSLLLFQRSPFSTAECGYVHELGHHKVHEIEQELLENGTLHKSHVTFLPTLASRITHEGLADYFCREFYGPGKHVQWNPSKPEDYIHRESSAPDLPFFFGRLDYWASYQVMKPILDACGVEKGTKAVLIQPQINEQELIQPTKYQDRAIAQCKQ